MQASDNQTSRSAPQRRREFPATDALLVINGSVFLLMMVYHSIRGDLDPLQWGWDWGPLSLNGQWWRLLTSTFVHNSDGHLLGNVLFLWFLGKRMERIFGSWAFLLFYLSCSVVGSLSSLAFHPEFVSCGASPGIFGLAGGLISVYVMRGVRLSKHAVWKLVLLILWTAYSVYPDKSVQGVNNAAHIGGLLAGLALGAVLALGFAQEEQRQYRRRVFSAMAALLVVGAMCVRYYHSYLIPLKPAAKALAQGRPDDALRYVGISLHKKPGSVHANVLAADAYLAKDDFPDAEAAARRALASAEGLGRDYDHATYDLGLVKLHTGYCEEAHEIGNTLSLYSNSNDKHEAHSLSIAQCDLTGYGDRFFSEGHPDWAIGFYNRALREKPDNYRAQVGLA